ncbi:MAG: paraquat-inducible protein A [Phycisphaerae bacterium]
MIAKCARCGSAIEKRTPGSLHVTGALALAALILYIPANVFPIMRLDMHGVETENTVWSGVKALWLGRDYFIAVVVFLASIAAPLLKLTGLFFVVIATAVGSRRGLVLRTWMYRVVDVIGRWQMLDVFVLAIVVSGVKLEQLATIVAGKGMAAFAAVVVLTLLASESFDPELIWRGVDEDDGNTKGTKAQRATRRE